MFVGGYDPGIGAYGAGAEPVMDAPVLSDAERYRAATGAALPLQHGMLVLPPTSPRGDSTYLWSNTGAD